MRLHLLHNILLPLLLVLLPTSAGYSAERVLTDPGFERTEAGKESEHWRPLTWSTKQGYRVRVSDAKPFAGRRCLEVEFPGVPMGFGYFALVTQSVPAEAFRGKRIRFTSHVRAEVPPSSDGAGLHVRVLRPDFRPGHSAEMADRPARSDQWQRQAVIVDVAPDAEALEVGFRLSGAGKAWFDEASIEVIGKAGEGNVPPRPVTDRGMENLVALARLLGVVRYFHPSDGVAGADWERFTIEAVEVVESARTADERATRLSELFAPLAPAVQVFPTGKKPPRPAELENPPEKVPFHVLGWRHVGVAANGIHGAYRSERVVDKEVPGGAKLRIAPEPLAKPSEPYEADLGGGVSCRVPVALYADAKGTLPHATAKPRKPTKSAEFPPTGEDRSTRLACVMLAWNLFQHFYPYFDAVKVDWPEVLRESLKSAATDRDAASFHDTLKRLVASAEDSHGTVRGGSGTVVLDGALPLAWDWIENRLVVVSTEADHAGRIKPGDVVTAINGIASGERVKTVERLVSGATPQFRRYRSLQELRNGPAGEPVELEIRPAKGEPYKISLKRRHADGSPLRGPNLREWRLPRLHEVKPGFLYVDLDRFNAQDFFREAFPKMRTAQGIVFDVRGYPTVPATILQMLTEKPIKSDRFANLITRFPDRKAVKLDERDWSLEPLAPRVKAKVAFLTDGRAVSYAETFMSLVANHKLGPIVGGPTAGSNGGVNVYVLPGGYRVSYTGQRALRQDGTRFHGVGVRPTHSVDRTARAVAEGRDEVLEKAIDLVRP